MESSGVKFPTLETNYDDLCPLRPGEPQNLFTDMRRFSDHMDHINKRFYTYLRVPPERQTVIRDLKRLKEEAKELFEVLDQSGKKQIPVGLDTEKNLSTLQFSFFLRDHYGQGKHYEKNLFLHLKTARAGRRNILQGNDKSLIIKIITDARFVFIAKNARKEIGEICQFLGIADEVRDKIKYIEVDEIYNFVFNLLWSPERAHSFLQTDHLNKKIEKVYWSCLGDIGLKTFVQLCYEGYTIPKRQEWRDHLNNFDEWRGPLSPEMITYALNDLAWALLGALNLCERTMGFNLLYFSRAYGEPHKLIFDALLRILLVMAKGAEASVVTKTEKTELKSINKARFSKLDMMFVNNQFRFRMESKKKEIFKRERKEAYDEGTYSVGIIAVSPQVLCSRPVKEAAEAMRNRFETMKPVFEGYPSDSDASDDNADDDGFSK